MSVAWFSIWVVLFLSPLSVLNIVSIIFQAVICLLILVMLQAEFLRKLIKIEIEIGM